MHASEQDCASKHAFASKQASRLVQAKRIVQASTLLQAKKQIKRLYLSLLKRKLTQNYTQENPASSGFLGCYGLYGGGSIRFTPFVPH